MLRPSGDSHIAACCTSVASLSCWCHRNAARTGHTCGRACDPQSRIISPHCAPAEQTSLLVRAVRTITPSSTIFRSSSAGYAWDARPSAYLVGPAWNVEPNHYAPSRESPSSVSRVAVAWLPWSLGRWPILPTDVEDCRLGENLADWLLETSVRAGFQISKETQNDQLQTRRR